MSDTTEQKQSKSNGLGIKANTIITALFGLLLSGIGFVNHLQTQSEHDDTMAAVKDLKLEMVGNYASKADVATAVASLSLTDNKLWEKNADLAKVLNDSVNSINLKLQHIQDSLPDKH